MESNTQTNNIYESINDLIIESKFLDFKNIKDNKDNKPKMIIPNNYVLDKEG